MKVHCGKNKQVQLIALISFFLVSWIETSCAPRAAAIQGDLARAIQEGIERGTEKFDHSKFDAVLRRYANVDQRRFDYAGLKSNEAELDAYLERIAQANLARLSRNELLALFINAYNAYTIQTILKSMTPERPQGVSSIRDIANVFDVKTHVVGKTTLSLNNIEHNIIRPFFKDPRIHFAVNCASVGCPPLANTAYTGERIDEQLDDAAKRTLQSRDYVLLENGRLRVTKVLDWYGSDFVTPGFRGAARTVSEYIARYASDEVKQLIASHQSKVSVEFLPYDWSLNRAQEASRRPVADAPTAPHDH